MTKYKPLGFEGRAAVMNICMEVWNEPKVTKDHIEAMTELLNIYGSKQITTYIDILKAEEVRDEV